MSLQLIRKRAPLIHNITNYVAANYSANGLLAVGASPIMADAPEEAADITAISDGLLINLGTLSQSSIDAFMRSGKKANELGIPVLFDPVGAGASEYRRQTAQNVLTAMRLSCIRCNAGELAALADVQWESRGVDAGSGTMDIATVADALATACHCLVVVTGEADYLTDGTAHKWIVGGSKRIESVTAIGCLLSSLCTAALTVDGTPFDSLAGTLTDYKRVIERAIAGGKNLGDVQIDVLNQLEIMSGGMC